MKRAIELVAITSTHCNLRCPGCPEGRKEPLRGGLMSMDMFERILAKCTAECKVMLAQLYFLNEPFLIPHMPQMVEACHRYKVPVLLSTNLTVMRHAPAILAQAPEKLMLSVSGWTQENYSKYHRGGNIEEIKKNMVEISKMRKPGCNVQISWHRHSYNEHEMPLMQAYAKELGFSFVSYGTSVLNQKKILKIWETGIVPEWANDCLVPPMEAKEMCYKKRHWDCVGQYRSVVVNSMGELMFCSWDDGAEVQDWSGSLFDTTIDAFFKAHFKDPRCIACKAVGGHVYGSQAYTRSNWSPTRLAGVLARRLGIEGYIEPVVRKLGLYGHTILPYARKQ